MGRFAVLFSVIFLLFTFSNARFITVEQKHDVKPEETVADLPESNSKTTNSIFLPSEKPGFEPAKRFDFKHDDASETHSDVESVPLTMISFHPINRHFPRRPMIPFRHKHNCRFHKRFRPFNPRFPQNRFISYGDDMILSDKRPRFRPEPRRVVHMIQPRWARFPDDDTNSKEHVDFITFPVPHHDQEHDLGLDHNENHHLHRFYHLHHRHHRHGEEDKRHEREEHGHDQEGGFLKSFRKFFTGHF